MSVKHYVIIGNQKYSSLIEYVRDGHIIFDNAFNKTYTFFNLNVYIYFIFRLTTKIMLIWYEITEYCYNCRRLNGIVHTQI